VTELHDTPTNAGPSRRNVAKVAAWTIPAIAVAAAAPMAAASPQAGWNVAVTSGSALSVAGLNAFTGFAIRETAAKTPLTPLTFTETYTIHVDISWLASSGAVGKAASLLIASTLVATLSTAALVTNAIGAKTANTTLGAWSALSGPVETALPDTGSFPLVRRHARETWTATRTVTVTGLIASGSAGFAPFINFQGLTPLQGLLPVISYTLTANPGSGGALTTDDTSTLNSALIQIG
jgi:hypothetical protein